MRESARELAHELKNLIGVASGSAELMLVQFEAALDPASREGLDMDSAHRHLARLLSSLERMNAYVTLTQKLLRGDGDEPSRFDLAELVERLVRDLEDLGSIGATEIRLEADPQRDFHVFAPRGDLLALLGRMLTLGHRGPIQMQLELSARYVQLRLSGAIFAEGDSDWGCLANGYRRSFGGDLAAERGRGGDVVAAARAAGRCAGHGRSRCHGAGELGRRARRAS
jgi:signal transduction histidine kinase